MPPGTKLTELKLNMDGDSVRITKPGTVLNAVHIPGSLLITADNVTITNSQIDGQIIGVYDNKRYSFTVSDSTVGPTDRCDTAPGILDAGFTATRVHIRGHGDGFSVSGDNVTIKDSFILLCSNPGDHSDGIQTVGASKNLTFHHNTVDQRKAPSHTAPVFLVDRTQGVTVTDNLLIGGTYTVSQDRTRRRRPRQRRGGPLVELRPGLDRLRQHRLVRQLPGHHRRRLQRHLHRRTAALPR